MTTIFPVWQFKKQGTEGTLFSAGGRQATKRISMPWEQQARFSVLFLPITVDIPVLCWITTGPAIDRVMLVKNLWLGASALTSSTLVEPDKSKNKMLSHYSYFSLPGDQITNKIVNFWGTKKQYLVWESSAEKGIGGGFLDKVQCGRADGPQEFKMRPKLWLMGWEDDTLGTGAVKEASKMPLSSLFV